VKKQDGARSLNDKTTKLLVNVFNSIATTDKEKPVYFPYYYVNGEEFTGENELVINFLDYAYASEMEQVRIPQHTVTETPLIVTSDFIPVFPPLGYIYFTDKLFSLVAAVF
jgi:hypothetical protein